MNFSFKSALETVKKIIFLYLLSTWKSKKHDDIILLFKKIYFKSNQRRFVVCLGAVYH